MGKKFLLTLLVFVLFPIAIFAQLSARTQLFLEQQKSSVPERDNAPARMRVQTGKVQSETGETETVQCFISLKEKSLKEIESEGAVINAKFDDIVLATVPMDKIEAISKKRCIKQIDIENPVMLLTDKARSQNHAEDVQMLSNAAMEAGLLQKYNGKGVVLGIIDDGIEFNHTAFKDANGKSRVKAVYLPNATTANGGTKKTIDGMTLKGYQYTTESQIAKLETDDNSESHGTHTTGCAGGSRVTTTGLKNNTTYGGMAPEADLVLCGCGSVLSNAAISSSVKYIANYAKEHNQPCVISISLGEILGPHDGTSSICKVYDNIANEYGSIIFLAAGNEGNKQCSLSKTLSSEDNYLGTVISPTEGFSSSYYCYGSFCVWNDSSDSLELQFIVLDSKDEAVYTSSRISSGKISASMLKRFFTATGHNGITLSAGVDQNNNRYNIYADIDLGPSSKGYKLAVLVYGKEGNTISMWNDAYNLAFTSANGSYTLTEGDGNCSVCDDITGSSTISVGAYCSRLSIPIKYGNSIGSLSNRTYEEQDIAYFSSHGTDFSGAQHPFVAAPGHSVISSVNRFDSSKSFEHAAYRKSLGHLKYDYWMYMSGTSMATPVAAGIAALWLQADPTLDVNGIKDIITKTSTHDQYTDGANRYKFGAGKIDALAGIQYILSANTPNNAIGDVNGDGIIDISDMTALVFIILERGSTEPSVIDNIAADVNADGIIDISDVSALASMILQ